MTMDTFPYIWCSIGFIVWVGVALLVYSMCRVAAAADAHIEAMKEDDHGQP